VVGLRIPDNYLEILLLNRDCREADARIAMSMTKEEIEVRSDASVVRIRRMIFAVITDIHRMKGFVRLQPLGECILCGWMKPQHKIGEKVSSFFARRFPGTMIILGDERESWAAHYRGRLQTASGGPLQEVCKAISKEFGVPAEGDIGPTNNDDDAGKIFEVYYGSQYTLERKNQAAFKRRMPSKSLREMGSRVERRGDCRSLDEFR
jgi:probable DNA metabolism protein